MTIITKSDLDYLTADELAEFLREESKEGSPSRIAIVDVRDTDYEGGHIKGCINVPSQKLEWKMPELVRTLRDKYMVVFHCLYSSQRGPAAAVQYLGEKEKLDGVPDHERRQKVFVLHKGFIGWREKYGTDPTLTEAYDPDCSYS